MPHTETKTETITRNISNQELEVYLLGGWTLAKITQIEKVTSEKPFGKRMFHFKRTVE